VKAECGSSRCTCEHTLCEIGWFTVPVQHPVTGQWDTASTKCLHCFPPVTPVESDGTGRPIRKQIHHDARDFGADYPDHAAAAAGEK
jgi:hypothetical protein